jgi:hypothetical protein
MTYLIARYINSLRLSITIILTALDRTKKDPNHSCKYNPTSNPRIIIEQLFISSNSSVIYLNLLTFYLPINEFETLRNLKVCMPFIHFCQSIANTKLKRNEREQSLLQTLFNTLNTTSNIVKRSYYIYGSSNN